MTNQIEFGKKPKTIWHYVRVGFLLKGTIDVVSLIPGIQKEKVFNLIDTVQQSIGIDVLNDYIIKDPELLGYRIKRIVSQAIKKHEDQSAG